jgi:hypothetical protein
VVKSKQLTFLLSVSRADVASSKSRQSSASITYLFTLCIEGRCGLMQEQNPWVSEQGPGYGNPLSLLAYLFTLCIEGRCGLIQWQNPWVSEQCLGYGKPLPLLAYLFTLCIEGRCGLMQEQNPSVLRRMSAVYCNHLPLATYRFTLYIEGRCGLIQEQSSWGFEKDGCRPAIICLWQLTFSLSVSRADVSSSKRRVLGFLSRAQALVILCLC